MPTLRKQVQKHRGTRHSGILENKTAHQFGVLFFIFLISLYFCVTAVDFYAYCE